MNKKVKIGLLSAMFSGLFFTACETYPGYDDYVDEQLISASSYDTKYNFSKSNNQVSLSDTVTYINDTGNSGTEIVTRDSHVNPKNPYTTIIYNAVKSNLETAGFSVVEYGQASYGATPLAASTTLIKSDVEVISYYPWWWYDWGWCTWDWWSCGYIPYVPYPYPYVVGAYDVGVMNVDIFNVAGTNKLKPQAVWSGIVRGLYDGTHTQQEVGDALKQCFDQTAVFPLK